jgi:hypothetical protein
MSNERTTRRINPKTLEGKEPLAAGYKIFNWDWTGRGNYCYADENGNVEGSVHTVTGSIGRCEWGLHFSKDPIDTMKYKDFVQWSRFAKVEAYDEILDSGDKTVCRTLKVVEVLSFDEMADEIVRYQKNISAGRGISDGRGISNGRGISDGYGISNGRGVYFSKFCYKCEGISHCIFCYDTTGKFMIFNKPVTEERFNEVWAHLGDWYPNYTNAEELKNKCGGKWECTPAPEIKGRTTKEAYSEMPKKLRDYIKSLPEYDEEIFKKITEEE